VSTNDVPGAKPENVDTLAMGCWAEADDGSLIFVEAVEAGQVVYSIFDLTQDPPVEYRDAMPESGFKSVFTWPTDTGDKWCWHDKTPMPWDRVMEQFKPAFRPASALGTMSAAQRVAKSLHLHGQELSKNRIRRTTPESLERGRTVMERSKGALNELRV
jgi:hypothetical protein